MVFKANSEVTILPPSAHPIYVRYDVDLIWTAQQYNTMFEPPKIKKPGYTSTGPSQWDRTSESDGSVNIVEGNRVYVAYVHHEGIVDVSSIRYESSE